MSAYIYIRKMCSEKANGKTGEKSGVALSTTEDIIRIAVTGDVVAQYYTAQYGNIFGVYSDGSICVGSSIGMEIEEDERPIAQIGCPGIGNIDSLFWTEGWTTRDEETGEYVTEDGRRLNLIECIEDCCENGEICEEKEAIIESLIESLKDGNEYDGY